MELTSTFSMADVGYTYQTASDSLTVLDGINLSLLPNETIALIGPSGCGKSTLLHLIGLLDLPHKGTIFFQKKLVSNLSGHARTHIRMGNMGFVYQHHNLLPEFNALENVMMPMWIAQSFLNLSGKEIHRKASEILEKMGLSDRLHHYPSQLSGGQQQRVAIARALVHNPPLIVADEPTGNLDPEKANAIADLLIDTTKNNRSTLIIATHNITIAQKCDRILTIEKGKLAEANPSIKIA